MMCMDGPLRKMYTISQRKRCNVHLSQGSKTQKFPFTFQLKGGGCDPTASDAQMVGPSLTVLIS